jgi:hypothetical protein
MVDWKNDPLFSQLSPTPLMSVTATFSVIPGVFQFSIRSVWKKTFFCTSSIIVAVPYFGGNLQTPATIFRQLRITFHNNLSFQVNY